MVKMKMDNHNLRDFPVKIGREPQFTDTVPNLLW